MTSGCSRSRVLCGFGPHKPLLAHDQILLLGPLWVVLTRLAPGALPTLLSREEGVPAPGAPSENVVSLLALPLASQVRRSQCLAPGRAVLPRWAHRAAGGGPAACVAAPAPQGGASGAQDTPGRAPPSACPCPCCPLAAPGTRRSETATSHCRAATSTPSSVKSHPQGAVPFRDSHLAFRVMRGQQGACPSPSRRQQLWRGRGVGCAPARVRNPRARCCWKNRVRRGAPRWGVALALPLPRVRSCLISPRHTPPVPVGQREGGCLACVPGDRLRWWHSSHFPPQVSGHRGQCGGRGLAFPLDSSVTSSTGATGI